jgi:predicted nucleotide-binding protein (sugar kinase/HSP70/actin superfamily)
MFNDIERRCADARRRLEARAHIVAAPIEHYRLPPERPFSTEERGEVTILFGGLTSRHERLVQAVFESCGYRSLPLPQPDLAACLTGKHYCNPGVCNPAYFTVGNLVRFLQQLEAGGMTRQDIIDRYVFFTAGSCGPCRFGMYEAEYRLALRGAGFGGFRVLLFQQDHGVKADTGEPGLKLSVHLGMGAVRAFTIADALQAFGYDMRPYETRAGTTDRVVGEALDIAARSIASRQALPGRYANVWAHLYGSETRRTLSALRSVLQPLEVDRLRVKPVVKVTGEFWAQSTETDGNFRMFEFLEQEGAHVLVEPIGGWVMYLLQSARERLRERRGLDLALRTAVLRARLIDVGERLYRHQYDRLRRALNVTHALVDQRTLARLAEPFYRQLARGGEGHLEVAKNIYFTTYGEAHMVLSLKPFGCMPSTQSDGVQSALLSRLKDTIFVSVETGSDGELTARNRVEMALVEARERAQEEFDRALGSSGRALDDIRRYVADHPEMRAATYRVPRRRGIAGVAATFVLHVADRMNGRWTAWPGQLTPAPHRGAR